MPKPFIHPKPFEISPENSQRKANLVGILMSDLKLP
ncbi:hypothetical protein Ocin01_18060 [Orchesella cincta]|uniref:Uncharacterized protein n=1 Tax=Orchesella cincta TaxID=48709 RepID=A0A1D2M6S8_ORCCI|nr:hypothetical protein Ocin01_18060 [Orchesella cincta]